MLSQEAELALGRLAEGAVLNPIHTTARELIEAGLAVNDWGHLALTESGRRLIRGRGRIRGRYTILNEHVSDLSMYQNPMGLGPEVPADIGFVPSPTDFAAAHEEVAKATISETVTVRPPSYYDRAIAAAGVASGKTGEWPTPAWVHEFMNAFGEDDEADK